MVGSGSIVQKSWPYRQDGGGGGGGASVCVCVVGRGVGEEVRRSIPEKSLEVLEISRTALPKPYI